MEEGPCPVLSMSLGLLPVSALTAPVPPILALLKHTLVAEWHLSLGGYLASTFTCPGSPGSLALLIPGSPLGALAQVQRPLG